MAVNPAAPIRTPVTGKPLANIGQEGSTRDRDTPSDGGDNLSSAFLDSTLRFLREAFTENIGLKVLSFTFAVGLFAFMYGQQEEQQRTIPVAVVMRPPPEGSQRELMTQIPASIHVTLRGQGRAIERLVQTGVPPVEIDLRSASAEQVVFDDSMFSLPPDVSVSMIDPPSIDLEWEDVIARQIPVQASITGQPAEGYVVKGSPTSIRSR